MFGLLILYSLPACDLKRYDSDGCYKRHDDYREDSLYLYCDIVMSCAEPLYESYEQCLEYNTISTSKEMPAEDDDPSTIFLTVCFDGCAGRDMMDKGNQYVAENKENLCPVDYDSAIKVYIGFYSGEVETYLNTTDPPECDPDNVWYYF